MSEFTSTKEKRLAKLHEVSKLILETGSAHSFITANKDFIPSVHPSDFIALFDEIVEQGYPMEEVKVLSNKVLNIFHKPIKEYPREDVEPDSFLAVLEENNREMERILNKIRSVFKLFVKDSHNSSLRSELAGLFGKLEVFSRQYTIKENILFPFLEKAWPDYRCVQIMWSFHDDIRRNIRTILDQLTKEKTELEKFNRCVGDVFFNMSAIRFREERILFPRILSTISRDDLLTMNREGVKMGYPYIQPAGPEIKKEKTNLVGGLADLGTGVLSVEQIKLIFNHLPVDITYVDEENKVRFFSSPPKRIFPRTVAIIGREVSNCHPPESVHVVEKIVESFRNGEKSQADFWIKFKGAFILIQYFAVRDEAGNYRGVIEVSQEISEIKELEGEKRLLDW